MTSTHYTQALTNHNSTLYSRRTVVELIIILRDRRPGEEQQPDTHREAHQVFALLRRSQDIETPALCPFMYDRR
jgi:hypothetical protein